jgi:hypothetical protein
MASKPSTPVDTRRGGSIVGSTVSGILVPLLRDEGTLYEREKVVPLSDPYSDCPGDTSPYEFQKEKERLYTRKNTVLAVLHKVGLKRI